jgi:parallel beta-helix repeat protein
MKVICNPRILKSLVFLSIFTFITQISYSQGMSGSYTIGGTNPDFNTFKQAYDTLYSKGVSGAVVFNVRQGTYNQQILMNHVSGMSSTNTVTFQSDNGDSSQVILTYTPSSSANYVVWLNGADYFTFKQITIQATGSQYAMPVRIESSSIYNNFIRCRIIGSATNNSTQNLSLIYEGSGNNTNNLIEQCYLLNGSYGIYASSADNLIIKKNVFINQYYHSIYLTSCDACKIESNLFYGDRLQSYYAVYLSDCDDDIEITKNSIHMKQGSYAFYLTSCNASSSSYGLIANNFISATGSGTFYGFYLNDCSYQNIYYNSVNVKRGYSSSYCIRLNKSYYGSTSNIQLQNNSFVIEGGYCIHADYSSAINVSDYNNLYSGGYIGYWYNSSYSTLSSWQTASNKDANSVSFDPIYVSDTDLHVQNYLLDNKGYAVSGVSEDIDGETRSLSSSDIGADEWTTPQNDAGVVSIDPSSTLCIRNDSIYVTIKNYGEDTLNSCTINWEVNGQTQTAYSWTGSLLQGSTEGLINIGYFNFSLGTRYSIKAWTNQPNNSTDGFGWNDTAELNNQYKAMSGTYTIGGTNPDYNTINSAVTDLENGGVCGPVVFNIRNGIYNEQVRVGSVAGASSTNTVTFQSENQDSTLVTLTYTPNSSADYTLDIYNSDYLKFQYLKIKSVGSQYANPVKLENGSTHITFRNCIIEGVNTNSTSTSLATILVSNSSHYMVLENNIIVGGSYGIYFSTSNYGEIRNNYVLNSYRYGMYLSSTTNLKVHNNKLESNSSYSSYISINLLSSSNYELKKNRIYQTVGSEAFQASSSNGGHLSNNFIVFDQPSSSSRGLYFQDCSNTNLYYNTVVIKSGSSSSMVAYFYKSYYGSSSNFHIQNNNFVNYAGGYLMYVSSTSSINISDYNNLYTTGSNFGYYNGSVNTLASWRTSSNKDANSVSLDPIFVSDKDLHVQNYQLDDLGYGLFGVTDDIDGETRDLFTPDIGADEWTTPQHDCGVLSIDPSSTLCIRNDSVYVTIKNYGEDTLRSCTINWEVNGQTQSAYSWTGNLIQGSTEGLINIGYYNFNLGTRYSIKAWTSQPNSSADGFGWNDTAELNNQYKAMSGTYTIGGTNPDYNTINAAVTDLENGGVCGPVVFNIRNGIYNEQVRVGYVAGASSTNTVTFQSENQDSTLVTLTYTPNSSASYTLDIYNSDYLIFQYLKIKSVGSQYANPIKVENGSTHITFRNCLIEGVNTTNTSSNLATILFINSSHYAVIENNKIVGGSYGIYFSSSYYAEIRNNEVLNAYRYGMYLSSASSVEVINNRIESNTSYSSYASINLLSSSSYLLKKNRIYQSSGSEAFYASSSNSGHLSNNFIVFDQPSNSNIGLSFYDCSNTNLYYNTVVIKSGSSSSMAAYFYKSYYGTSTNFHIQNNNFVNYAGGYLMYVSSTSSINISDYNNLYTTGSNFGYYNGTINSLASWKTASNKDANSVSIDPIFVSDTNLHVQNYELDNLGYGLFGVTDDIDGETRDLFTPDIGADEWTTPQNDAGVVSIDPSTTLCIRNDSVYVTIKNYGEDTLRSCTINWQVNNQIQTAYNWTGSLLQGSTEGLVNIGYYNFSLGTRYSIKAWTSQPNNSTDGFGWNDTAELNNHYKAMSGTYTIGGTNPDYNTINAAVTDLENGGVCGPVVFNIRNGIYNEQLKIDNIQGTSASSTVTFQSESQDSTLVTVTYTPSSSTNYVLNVNQSDYLSFKFLKIKSVGSSYSQSVYLNYSSHFTFENCILEGSSATSSTSNLLVFLADGADYLKVENSLIDKGSTGLYVNNSDYADIADNIFSNQYDNALEVYSSQYMDFDRNKIYGTSNYSAFDAVYVRQSSNNGVYSNNELILSNVRYAFYLYTINNCTLYNNFISIAGGSSSATGFYVNDASSNKFFYNSINITASGSSTRCMYFYKSYYGSMSGNQLQNNIFSNPGGGYLIYDGYGSSISSSDYNNFYTTGSNIGYDNGNRTTLSQWQSAVSGDYNSKNVNPNFVSTTNLHVCSSALDGAGSPVSGISDDIDGESRDLTNPDIGADEFNTVLGVDLGSDTTSCGMVTLDAGNPGATFLWSNNATTQTISMQQLLEIIG